MNDDILAGALELPAMAVTPADIGCQTGWTAEQYWDMLGEAGARPAREARGGAGYVPSSRGCGSGFGGSSRRWAYRCPGLSRLRLELVAAEGAGRVGWHP